MASKASQVVEGDPKMLSRIPMVRVALIQDKTLLSF